MLFFWGLKTLDFYGKVPALLKDEDFYIFRRVFTKGVGMLPWSMCIILRNLFLQSR